MRNFNDGDPITGTYCGVPFNGTVIYARRNSRSGAIEVSVNLTTPIVALGDERQRIIVDTRMPRALATID